MDKGPLIADVFGIRPGERIYFTWEELQELVRLYRDALETA